uniref:Reticulon 4 interacting protein 1 n=1 Tax=Hucho hucho TaxID=62062 RepID=A0A4W5RAT5_9TELE
MHLLRQLSCGRGSCLLIRRAPCVKTFLHGGQKRLLNTSNSRMTIMPAWEINRYGSNNVLRFTKKLYLNFRLQLYNVTSSHHLGANWSTHRQCVIETLSHHMDANIYTNREFKMSQSWYLCHPCSVLPVLGWLSKCFFPSQVWVAILPWKHGSLAEIVVLSANVVLFLSKKTTFLSHTEVAAAPYVSATAWSALVNTGGLTRTTVTLILGGSGGSVFSSQMLKAWGAHVTVTCSQNAERLVRELEADHVVDYTAGPVEVTLRAWEKFDLVLDNVGADTESWALGLLKPWCGTKYVTLVTPFLRNTNLLARILHVVSCLTLLISIFRLVHYRWGKFAPNGSTLDDISEMVVNIKLTEFNHVPCQNTF